MGAVVVGGAVAGVVGGLVGVTVGGGGAIDVVVLGATVTFGAVDTTVDALTRARCAGSPQPLPRPATTSNAGSTSERERIRSVA